MLRHCCSRGYSSVSRSHSTSSSRAFTIGLAAWLTVLEAMHMRTGRPVYQALFEFWLKIFGVAFVMGVVSGVVMGFQFGTNWSVLAKMSGPIQGPLLSYEAFTAFML